VVFWDVTLLRLVRCPDVSKERVAVHVQGFKVHEEYRYFILHRPLTLESEGHSNETFGVS